MSANLNRIAEHRFFACCEAFTSLAVGEVAIEVLVVGVAVPWLDADERRAALARGPEAPVGEVLGDDRQRLIALCRAQRDFVRLEIVVGEDVVLDLFIAERQARTLARLRAMRA